MSRFHITSAEKNIQRRICEILRPLLGNRNLAEYVRFKRNQGLVKIEGREHKPEGVLVLALLDREPFVWNKRNLDAAVWMLKSQNPKVLVIEHADGMVGKMVEEIIDNSPTVTQVVWEWRKRSKIRVWNREEAIRFGRRFCNACR